MYFIFLWFPKVDILSENYKSFCLSLGLSDVGSRIQEKGNGTDWAEPPERKGAYCIFRHPQQGLIASRNIHQRHHARQAGAVGQLRRQYWNSQICTLPKGRILAYHRRPENPYVRGHKKD